MAVDIRRHYLLTLTTLFSVVLKRLQDCPDGMANSDLPDDPVLCFWESVESALRGMCQYSDFDEWESALYTVLLPFKD